MKNYEVSVVILTYRPDKQKLFDTLKSVVLQRNVRCQLVLADDGSACSHYEEVAQWLHKKGITDFRLVQNAVNQGTVMNVRSGLAVCEGTYVKLISPGDLLYDQNTLRSWVDRMNACNAVLSFGDAVYYRFNDAGERAPVLREAHPQRVDVYEEPAKAQIRRNYLLFGDLALGAAVLCNTAQLRSRIDQLAGKAIYAEDNAYRLMVFDGVTPHYHKENVILYEYGDGISTSANDVWTKRLRHDMDEADAIMLAAPAEDRFARELGCAMDARKYDSRWKRLTKMMQIRGYLSFYLGCRIHKRETSVEMPLEFLERIDGE